MDSRSFHAFNRIILFGPLLGLAVVAVVKSSDLIRTNSSYGTLKREIEETAADLRPHDPVTADMLLIEIGNITPDTLKHLGGDPLGHLSQLMQTEVIKRRHRQRNNN